MVVRSAQGPHIMTHMTAVVVQMHSSPSPFIRHVGILVTHEVPLLGPGVREHWALACGVPSAASPHTPHTLWVEPHEYAI